MAEQRSGFRAEIGRRVGEAVDQSAGLWRLTSSEQPFVRRTEFESFERNLIRGPIWGHSPLTSDAEADVVVIGSGIGGLSTAYELCRLDRSVIVINRGSIGRGMTAGATAHLASESTGG